jgi:VanZ family protein
MVSFIKKYALPCAVLWTALIFALCSTPGRYIPSASWLNLISFDKFVHASIFFVLQCLWMLTFGNRRATLLILMLCIAYGGALEIMQATVFSQRSADWLDFIANSFGCAMALLLFRKIKSRLFMHVTGE